MLAPSLGSSRHIAEEVPERLYMLLFPWKVKRIARRENKKWRRKKGGNAVLCQRPKVCWSIEETKKERKGMSVFRRTRKWVSSCFIPRLCSPSSQTFITRKKRKKKKNKADRAHGETTSCVTPKDLLRWRRGWDEPSPTRRCHTTTRLRSRRHLHESTQ